MEAGALGSANGQAALILSRRIDSGQEPGAALAQLVRQHRETLHAALANSEPAEEEEDAVVRIRRRLEAKRSGEL